MVQEKYTIKREKGKHLTLIESKGIDIGNISEEEIKRIERWMNSYPRKLFNGKSSLEIYSKEYTKYFS